MRKLRRLRRVHDVASLGLAYRGTQAGILDSKSLCDLTGSQKKVATGQRSVGHAYQGHRLRATTSRADYSAQVSRGQPNPLIGAAEFGYSSLLAQTGVPFEMLRTTGMGPALV
jgi:hypothetical protein